MIHSKRNELLGLTEIKFIITDNKLASLSEFDKERVDNSLRNLKDLLS